MNLNKNVVWTGLLIGLVIPFVGYAILLTIFEQLEKMGWATPAGLSGDFRLRTLSLAAIALNILPLNIFNNRSQGKTMRGIFIATLVYAVAWIIRFGSQIL